MGRGLKFIGKRQVEFIKYSSMLKGGKTIVKMMLTEAETEQAKQVIASGINNDIDNFCYSIS